MAQGKSKKPSQRPGDSLKKSTKKGSALGSSRVNKKKTEPRGGAKHNTAATTSMKTAFQKSINARIEVEVSQRARACESKSFTLIKPGEPVKPGTGPKKGPAGLSVKGTLRETSKKLQKKKTGKKN